MAVRERPVDRPVLVTSAAQSPVQERRDRERRYLLTMAARVVAIVVAIVFAHGIVLVLAIIASLVLPWVAVVAANSGPKQQPQGGPSPFERQRFRELE